MLTTSHRSYMYNKYEIFQLRLQIVFTADPFVGFHFSLSRFELFEFKTYVVLRAKLETFFFIYSIPHFKSENFLFALPFVL